MNVLLRSERQTILAKLQGLTYARSQGEYEEILADFLAIAPNPLLSHYFNQHWRPIREEWVEGLMSRKMNFNKNGKVVCRDM